MPGPRLLLGEREEIRAGIAAGESMRSIGRRLGRDPATISRELGRNGSQRGYVAWVAQRRADARARRPRLLRLEVDAGLSRRVREGLRQRKSPWWIAGELAAEGIGISPETIYRACYHPRQPLGAESHRLLVRRRRGRIRRRRTASGRIVKPLGDYKPIRQRPGDPHLEAGHWEGDLLVGKRNFTVAVVLTERRSRLTLIGACPQGRNSAHVADVVTRLLATVPRHLRRSLTWDQGSELARWATIETRLDMPVFFAQPRSPWQRPLAENTCGLLRRWLPRSQPMPHSQRTLDDISQRLNTMPRRILAGATATTTYDRLRVATTS